MESRLKTRRGGLKRLNVRCVAEKSALNGSRNVPELAHKSMNLSNFHKSAESFGFHESLARQMQIEGWRLLRRTFRLQGHNRESG
jgi:hypothetical protein